MALIDFLESAEKITNTPAGAENALSTTDIVMAQAAKTQENRMRREELQRKIDNLRKQNDELKARRESLKASTSLANLDEDKIVAIAKAKGIKDEDIDMWLKGRAQRSVRDISRAQTDELKEQNKAQDVQAIYEADRDYTAAFEKARLSQDETAASMDKSVLSAKNKLDTLKSQFKRRYGVTWEDYTNQPEEKEKRSVTVTEEGKEEGKGGEVILKDEEAAVLDETTLQKFNERDTTNKEKRAIKAEAQKKVRQKSEAEQARAKKLDTMRRHLATLGINANTKNITQIIKNAEKTQDKTIRDAVDALKSFVHSEKDFYGYNDLMKLFKVKEGK